MEGPDPRYPKVTALGHLENRQAQRNGTFSITHIFCPPGSVPPMEISFELDILDKDTIESHKYMPYKSSLRFVKLL